MPVPIADLLSLTPDAIIDLYVLDLNPIGTNFLYRFCNWKTTGGVDVKFQGQTYVANPFQASGFEITSRGPAPSPQVEFGNVFGVISSFALAYEDLVNATLTRKRTLAKYLDGMPNANSAFEYVPEVYVVDRKSEENSLRAKFDLKRRINIGFRSKVPNRIILKSTCPFIYRGSECGYTGRAIADENDTPTDQYDRDICGKRLNSCKLRFGAYSELPFGGFPGVDDI